MSVYQSKPERFLARLHQSKPDEIAAELYCAGFELEKWRCKQLAFHLIEWLPEYALPEEELHVNHANSLAKLNAAAIRVYTSEKYKSRGEAGEIALHAICRDYFDTIPISPRVFYKSATNDVIKAFDMVHVRFPSSGKIEIWLGESKLYQNGDRAIVDAIKSIRLHIDAGFLTNQKLLLGPQIPKSTHRYDEVMSIFKQQTSLDVLLETATFAIGILCDSKAAKEAKAHNAIYKSSVRAELSQLQQRLKDSNLHLKLRLILLFIPLASKKALVDAFDARLKGLQ